MTVNKYGLPRHIPSRVKRKVRNDCGYGCVICGNAIYQYEHIDPPFAEAKTHNPKAIALLCGSCHDKVTRRIWSKQKVLNARRNPYCKQQGFAPFSFDLSDENEFIVGVGNNEFVKPFSIIEIDGVDILSIKPPEVNNTLPRISAIFYDRNNQEIASIYDNEWRGSTEAFDIEIAAELISIRSAPRKIDLKLSLYPPTKITIDKLNLQYNGTKIVGDTSNGFLVELENSSLKLPNDNERITNAPFWVSVKENRINLGRNAAYYFRHQGGKTYKEIPGYVEIIDSDVQLVDPVTEGLGELPEQGKGLNPNRKVYAISPRKAGGGISFPFKPPKQEKKSTKKKINPFGKKVSRNNPCPCGSGIKYKYCHGK